MSDLRPCEHEALPDEWEARHGELLHAWRDARAENRALRGRVATLEGAMRDHDDCRVCLGLLDD